MEDETIGEGRDNGQVGDGRGEQIEIQDMERMDGLIPPQIEQNISGGTEEIGVSFEMNDFRDDIEIVNDLINPLKDDTNVLLNDFDSICGVKSDVCEVDDHISMNDISTSSSDDSSDSEPLETIKDDLIDEEDEIKEKIKSKNEILVDELPIENIEINIDPTDVFTKIGSISSIVDSSVVVLADIDSPTLEFDTVLFTEDKKVVGKIEDIFGAINRPYYMVRTLNKNVHLNVNIYYLSRITQYIEISKINIRGTDASNKDDEEPNENERKLIEMDEDEFASDDSDGNNNDVKNKKKKKKKKLRVTPNMYSNVHNPGNNMPNMYQLYNNYSYANNTQFGSFGTNIQNTPNIISNQYYNTHSTNYLNNNNITYPQYQNNPNNSYNTNTHNNMNYNNQHPVGQFTDYYSYMTSYYSNYPNSPVSSNNQSHNQISNTQSQSNIQYSNIPPSYSTVDSSTSDTTLGNTYFK